MFYYFGRYLKWLSVNISDGFVPIGKNEFEKKHDANAEALEKAIDEVVAKQLDLGIDVVNDGELPRENYFLHFVRKIKGIDADNLVAKTVRNGKHYQSKSEWPKSHLIFW